MPNVRGALDALDGVDARHQLRAERIVSAQMLGGRPTTMQARGQSWGLPWPRQDEALLSCPE